MNVNATVVVPTYNERTNLPILVTALMAHDGVGVLIVDDQSPDGTADVGDELGRSFPGRVEVLRRTGTRGLGRSYVDGFRRSILGSSEVVCQMDADLSHNPGELARLLAASRDADLVIGSRYVRGGAIGNWSWHRRALSRFANLYVRAVTRLTIADCTSGYRCWRRSLLEKMALETIASDGYSFQVEMAFRASRLGCRIVEVPITFVERREGQSKMSRSVIFESAIMPWRLVSQSGGRP